MLAATNANPEYVELLRAAAISASGARGVIEAIEDGLADPNRQSEARTAVAHDLFYRPGSATTRALHELYELMELEEPPRLEQRSSSDLEAAGYLRVG